MYKITFEDNTVFTNNSTFDSRWNDMPDKNISEFIYELKKIKFKLKGYEEYNHLIEQINTFNRTIYSKIILMGKKGLRIDCIIIDLKLGKIYKQIKQFGFEYNNKPSSGWKKGTSNTIPSIQYAT